MPDILEPNTLIDDKSVLRIVDQTELPGKIVFLDLKDTDEIYDAIRSLRVRGAPAIGIAAGFAAYLEAKKLQYCESFDTFHRLWKEKLDYYRSSRPTAVNLSYALDRMEKCALDHRDMDLCQIISLLKTECENIRLEDIEQNKRISQLGLSLLKDGDTVLTHCNAGPLATSRYGTALGPILLAKEKGLNIKVFADETRPLLQGARLTSFELHNAGVDVTLICDSMASLVMKQGKIDACLVGCDRVAMNGDTANKIGTSGLAVLCRHYNIPFYVLGPTTTIDRKAHCGSDIEIELRSGDEIKTMWYEKPMAPMGVKCYNPAFDVTDASLISAIVTEKGIIYPPYKENLKRLFNENI